MHLLRELVVSLWGPLAFITLVALSGVLVAGRTRRREWARLAMNIRDTSDDDLDKLIERAEKSQRAADYLHLRIRHISYITILIAAISLTSLPYVRISGDIELPLWVGLNVVMILGGCLLLFYWHGWDDEREAVLRRRIRLAREALMERRGLTVRDPLTGAYTIDFWLHSLELEARRGRRGGTPITCMTIQVIGLHLWRTQGGAIAAAEVLQRVARELQNNVRAKDVVCALGDDRFALGLLRCQPAMAEDIGERVSSNITRMVFNALTFHGWRNVRMVWSYASLPRDGRTPVEVLRRAERTLDNQLGAATADVGGRAGSRVA
jgi:diguanylate cyclase (GGDEF)-like protein